MKKIYSLALVAVAILSATSCQKELVNENFDNAGDKFTVTAVASAETKTVLEGKVSYWTPGDKISVFDATGKSVAFTTAITEKAASAVFTNAAAFTAPSSELVAVYPDRGGVQAYADGVINKIFCTNLVYRQPELLTREWFVEVNMCKYVAYIVDTLNHDRTISNLLNQSKKIHTILDQHKKNN